MEFMYCIPDLEVFIDKTIKKCLLEYDLDANDTEAVLDDMEKAWPKSPSRPIEKQVLKDCNDNTENGRCDRQLLAANQVQEFCDKSGLKSEDMSLLHKACKLAERLHTNQDQPEELLSNGKMRPTSRGGDISTSDTSTPDDSDGKLQILKHSKPKSRLQQRYFEGSKNCDDGSCGTMTADIVRVDDSRKFDEPRLNNLDLLASAANIHTDSSRGTEEHRIRAIQRLQEESEKYFHEMASRSYHENSTVGEEAHIGMKFVTSSVTSHPVHYNNHDRVILEEAHSSSPKISVKEPHCLKLHSESFSPAERQFLNTTRPNEINTASLVNSEKVKRLYQYYQNGYNAVIPREKIITQKQLSPKTEEEDPRAKELQKVNLVPGPFSINTRVPVSVHIQSDRLESSPHYRHFPINHQCNSSPEQHQVSRIASIIAEELEKDHIPQAKTPSRQVITTVERVMTVGCSTPPELIYCLPKHSNKRTSMELPHRASQTEINTSHQKESIGDYVFQAHSQKRAQHMPAHFQKPNNTPGTGILGFHLGHSSSVSNCSVANTGSTAVIGEDLPEDLSTKSGKATDNRNYSCNIAHVNSAVTESRKRGYFSSPSSPLSFPANGSHVESLAWQKSSSPSNSSDRQCDYRSGSDGITHAVRKSGKWEKKGQVHGLDIYSTSNSNIHVENLKRVTGSAVSKKSKTE